MSILLQGVHTNCQQNFLDDASIMSFELGATALAI